MKECSKHFPFEISFTKQIPSKLKQKKSKLKTNRGNKKYVFDANYFEKKIAVYFFSSKKKKFLTFHKVIQII